ncbi:hypothetical protein THAOC_05666, partial [Thalassiosira oceanica]
RLPAGLGGGDVREPGGGVRSGARDEVRGARQRERDLLVLVRPVHSAHHHAQLGAQPDVRFGSIRVAGERSQVGQPDDHALARRGDAQADVHVRYWGGATVALGMRSEFEDLLYEYRVDLVLSGHYHSYLRTCDGLYRGECKSGGPTYVTVGTGGAPLDGDGVGFIPNGWTEVYDNRRHGVGRAGAYNASAMLWEFVAADDGGGSGGGAVTDSVWLRRNRASSPLSTAGATRTGSAPALSQRRPDSPCRRPPCRTAGPGMFAAFRLEKNMRRAQHYPPDRTSRSRGRGAPTKKTTDGELARRTLTIIPGPNSVPISLLSLEVGGRATNVSFRRGSLEGTTRPRNGRSDRTSDGPPPPELPILPDELVLPRLVHEYMARLRLAPAASAADHAPHEQQADDADEHRHGGERQEDRLPELDVAEVPRLRRLSGLLHVLSEAIRRH